MSTSNSNQQQVEPQPPTMCANNCGFYGNPANKNLCSKCFTALVSAQQIKETSSKPAPDAASTITASTDQTSSTLAAASSSNVSASPCPPTISVKQVQQPEETNSAAAPDISIQEPATSEKPQQIQKNKCWDCKKKVGLLGFTCRCGYVYCADHRYPEDHCCDFDHKAFGREELSKANPGVVGKKVESI
eukprot:GHVL01010661.1.p1 GENE.GHVL01010661.1~~GHVL01010661.1.p1  ORF type:complete len:189 (+),score=24.77 GHVL01010661.1:174-740(+)